MYINFDEVKDKYEKLKDDYRIVVKVNEGSETTVSIQFWKRLFFNGEEYFSNPCSCFYGDEINDKLTIKYNFTTFDDAIEEARYIAKNLDAEIRIVRWYD